MLVASSRILGIGSAEVKHITGVQLDSHANVKVGEPDRLLRVVPRNMQDLAGISEIHSRHLSILVLFP